MRVGQERFSIKHRTHAFRNKLFVFVFVFVPLPLGEAEREGSPRSSLYTTTVLYSRRGPEIGLQQTSLPRYAFRAGSIYFFLFFFFGLLPRRFT